MQFPKHIGQYILFKPVGLAHRHLRKIDCSLAILPWHSIRGQSIHWPRLQHQSVFYGSWQHNYYYYCQQRHVGRPNEQSISLDVYELAHIKKVLTALLQDNAYKGSVLRKMLYLDTWRDRFDDNGKLLVISGHVYNDYFVFCHLLKISYFRSVHLLKIVLH